MALKKARRWQTALAALVPAAALLSAVAMANPATAASYPQLSPGYVGVVKGYDSLCLDDRGYLPPVNNIPNPVQEYQCNGTKAQTWEVFDSSGGQPQFAGDVNIILYYAPSQPGVFPGTYCLDVYGGNTGNGTTVGLYQCNGTAAQQWIARPGGALYNPNFNKCLDDTGWATNGHTQLDIWDCTGEANQVWLGYQ